MSFDLICLTFQIFHDRETLMIVLLLVLYQGRVSTMHDSKLIGGTKLASDIMPQIYQHKAVELVFSYGRNEGP